MCLLIQSLVDTALASWAHNGILAAHSAVESAVQLGTEGELLHRIRLLLAQNDALGGESLVLHAIKAGRNIADFVGSGVVGFDGGGQGRGSGTVCAEPQRGTGLCAGGLRVSWHCCGNAVCAEGVSSRVWQKVDRGDARLLLVLKRFKGLGEGGQGN